jgi:conjugative transfer signal peptidase TraF
MNKRVRIVATALAAMTLISSSMIGRPNPVLLWNASASAPIGLYLVHPLGKLEVATLVVVQPPESLADMLAEGGFLPRGVPLIKRVLGLAGQTVCRVGLTVTVGEIDRGSARERDYLGRKLPAWQGCHKLIDGEVFLMNADEPASLDGRYFGPLLASSIVGRADPLWTSVAAR